MTNLNNIISTFSIEEQQRFYHLFSKKRINAKTQKTYNFSSILLKMNSTLKSFALSYTAVIKKMLTTLYGNAFINQ